MMLKKVAAVVAVVMGALSAQAEVIDVAVGGDIAAAVTAAKDGDVIQLAKGEYVLASEVTIANGVTVKGAGRFFTRIVSDGTEHRLFTLDHPDAALADLELSGARLTKPAENIGGGGAYVKQGTVRDALVTDCRTGSGDGGAIAVGVGTISRVIATRNYGRYGGAFFPTKTADCTIENCFAYKNDSTYGGGIYVEAGAKAAIVNCTLADNTGNGKDFYDYSGSGFAACTNCALGNKVINGNAKNSTRVNCVDDTTPTGYVSLGGGNCRLQADSPLLAAGVACPYEKDVEGNPFPDGAPSIGAYQLADPAAVSAVPVSPLVFRGESAKARIILPEGSSGVLTVIAPDGTRAAQDVEDGEEAEFAVPVPGSYSLVLEADGVVVWEGGNILAAGIGNVYVNPKSASPVAPYDTPETAATTIEAAIDAVLDGGTVWLLDDVQLAKECLLVRPVTVRGRTKVTITAAGDNRLFKLQNTDARLVNLKLKGDKQIKLTGLACSVVGGGRMEDCEVTDFDIQSDKGAAVCVEGGVFVAERCVFARNSAASYGGAAYNKATGTMHFRNCLFYRNTGRGNWGSAVYNDGPGSMVNCTLFNNPVTPASQGEFCRNYAAFGVTNCVFGSVSWYTGGTAHRMNNVESASDPGFVSAGGDDYRLSAAAERLIDQGEDSAVREGEVDLDGKPRVSGDHIDIGCHEFAQDVFSAGFMVEGEASKPGDTVRLVPKIVGGKNPVNTWRVENLAGGEPIGGQTVGTDATAAFEVTLTAPGVYSFYQQVTDGENGADNALPRYLAVLAEGDVFVAKDGASVPPFDTPATATTNLYAAVTMAGDGATVHVGPGTFLVDQRTALSHAATLVGAGVDQTVITAEPESSHGLVLVEHPRAVLRNVMLTGVFGSRYSDGHGGCARLLTGAIEDCAITGGVMRATCDGTMLALETGSGMLAKPRASRVRVAGCRGAGFGTVIMNSGAVADNLLLVDCEVTPILHYKEPYGGLLYIDQSGGYVTNCTFVGTQSKAVFNYAGLSGVSTKMSGCVFDCPVSVVKDKVATNFFFRCASLESLPEYVEDSGNVVVEDMGFVDKANGDYHLRVSSPCRGLAEVNPGIKLDFDRKRRAKNGVVDAGCYQFHGYGLMMFAR